MKYFFLFLIIIGLSPLAVLAADYESSINAVTLFERGAQIERRAQVRVNKGLSFIEIKGLSEHVDPSAIQAKITGAKIVSVAYSMDDLEHEEKDVEKKRITEALSKIDYELKLLKNKREINEQELTLIQKNIDIKGKAVLDVADLEDFLIFYRSNLPLIKGSLLAVEEKETQLKKKQTQLKQQLLNLKELKKRTSAKVALEVSSTKAFEASLVLNYYVPEAGWKPCYNLRASSLEAPIQMEFYAQVHQNTGVEWEKVALTIATGTPHFNGNAQRLSPWRIGFNQGYSSRYNLDNDEFKASPYGIVEQKRDDLLVENKKSLLQSNSVSKPVLSSTEKITFREYKIQELYHISSNGKSQRVAIENQELAAEYVYFSAPKLSTAAYLMAKVADWEKHRLVSGKTHVYFEGTFVGNGYLNVSNTEDTLAISLGQDKRIVVERAVKLNRSSKQYLGLKETQQKAYELVMKNNKSVAVKIEVVDQIPISKDSAIKVKLLESSGAAVNKDTGELSWFLRLGAFEKISRPFEFQVIHPKSKKIAW
jgi:uncharacterized protein (TIGR02231 family)